jgi:carbonic anhydrase
VGQDPFVIAPRCSNSRVPVAQIIDLGLGERVVNRAAGNIVRRPIPVLKTRNAAFFARGC